MKRKLGSDDEPIEDTDAPTNSEDLKFAALGLDNRLIQALRKAGLHKCTPVQAKGIPLALEGKDVLARAKTGSGKTVAYLLPILQSILKRKADANAEKNVSALILVPTRELAEQIQKVIQSFSIFCTQSIRSLNIAQKLPQKVQRALLSELPDIVVSTPSQARICLKAGSLDLAAVSHLVIDEADLVFSYGYEADLNSIAASVPKRAQKSLMSATLTTEVESLKSLFCRNPEILKLEDKDEEELLTQYVVKCAEEEKFLLAYVIFKLQLIKGKSLIFVDDVDRCYRLKLFFEQFGIRSCVLNSELPVNSRIHVVQEFNRNKYDIIIATDEHEALGDGEDDPDTQIPNAESKDTEEGDEEGSKTSKTDKPQNKRKKGRRRDKEYGISRGIDFKNTACVLNFDLPLSANSYTHRVGRTARGRSKGIALSFVVPKNLYRKHKPTSIKSGKQNEEVLAKIIEDQAQNGREVKPYDFDMEQVEAFRYRVADALRCVTKIAVQDARKVELRNELINSEKLKLHFEEHPEDLKHLRHDGEARTARTQAHLKHVPDYLLPANGGKALTENEIGFVKFNKDPNERKKRIALRRAKSAKKKGRSGKSLDPLKRLNGRRKA